METGTVSATARPGLQGTATVRRFSRTSWAVLAVAAALLALSLAQRAYRLRLPTDGWQPAVAADPLTFERNVLGLASPLHVGDQLLAVEGQDVRGWEDRGLRGELVAPANWQAGQFVRYTVLRDGQTFSFAVPLAHWTPAVLARSAFEQLIFPEPSLIIFAVSLFVFYRRPDNHSARLLLLLGAAGLVSQISWIGSPGGLAELFAGPLLAFITLVCSHLSHAQLIAPLTLWLISTFQHPGPRARRRPWLIPALVFAPPLVITVIYTPLFLGQVALYNLIGIALLVRALVTVRDPVGQAQLRWFAAGWIIANIGVAASVLQFLQVLPAALAWMRFIPGTLIQTLCLAVAILRYRLFDIDVIINRTLVYGALSAFVIVVYIGVVGYVGALFHAENNLVPSLAATGIIAVAFQPLRERLQRGVNRLLYGERDDPYAVLSHLGERLEATFAPQEALQAVVETVATALKLPYAALRIGQGAEMLTAAAYRAEAAPGSVGRIDTVDQAESQRSNAPVAPPSDAAQSQMMTLPLTYQGEPLGALLLAPRPGEQDFSLADRKLLHDLARRAGVAVHALRLATDLQHSRARLVTAREEERRRLRRDLHDGLGPALAGLTLKLDAAHDDVDADPAAAKAQLVDLKHDVQAAIADIRRLVHELRPPALDELGLASALRVQTTQYQRPDRQVTVDAPEHLPPLPAAVEAAAYRIALEALTNVVRHANAQRCVVQLAVVNHVAGGPDGRALALEVCDDGVGMPADYLAGVGLLSMRERAAELGGTWKIETSPGAGTCIRVRLPLPPANNAEEQ